VLAFERLSDEPTRLRHASPFFAPRGPHHAVVAAPSWPPRLFVWGTPRPTALRCCGGGGEGLLAAQGWPLPRFPPASIGGSAGRWHDRIASRRSIWHDAGKDDGASALLALSEERGGVSQMPGSTTDLAAAKAQAIPLRKEDISA
jgi:hypothetical protein